MALSVLVVEDEVIVASDLCEMLRQAGHDVPDPAHSVTEARERFEENDYDLVFMDINLSENEAGLDLAKEWSDRTDVVFVSAYLDEETLGRAESTGAIGYLTKPTTEDQVLDVTACVENEADDLGISLRRGALFGDIAS